MSQPSPLESYATAGPRPRRIETGWDLLGYAWPGLLITVGYFWSLFVVFGADTEAAIEGFYLSRASLADGRWWTLLSHIFVNSGLGSCLVVFAMFLAALTTVATANPGWMGGWRTPAVFFGAALLAALTHLALASTAPLTGPWSAGLGLGAYYILSRRLASIFPGDALKAINEGPGLENAASQAMSWSNSWFLVLVLAPMLDWVPSILPAEWFVAFAVGASVVLGGGAAVYALARFGGRWGERIAGLLVGATHALTVTFWVYALGRWLLAHPAEVLGLPWPSYAVGLAVGVVAGLVERRSASAP